MVVDADFLRYLYLYPKNRSVPSRCLIAIPEMLQVTLLFGTRMDDLVIRDGHLVGIQVSPVIENSESACPTTLEVDAVILGVGHSARDVYENLHRHNVLMTPKDFAVCF